METGAEFDSNPSREETVAGRADTRTLPATAARLVLGGEASRGVGERFILALSGRGAVRWFPGEAARADSAGIADGNASATALLARRTALAASFAYYEAFQSRGDGARDFRSLSPAAQLDQGHHHGRFSLGAGYRVFSFKPGPDFDFTGPRGFLSYRHQFAPGLEADDGLTSSDTAVPADWDFASTLLMERRTFAGPRCVQNAPCPTSPPSGARVDDFTAVSLELQRTSDFLIAAGGAAHINVSNSFGAGLLRIGGYLKGAFSLPWRFTLAWRAEIATSHYAAKIPVARDRITGLPVASIEDENRNTLRLELYRPLAGGFDLAARYVGHVDEFGSGPVDYERQTFLLALGWSYQPE